MRDLILIFRVLLFALPALLLPGAAFSQEGEEEDYAEEAGEASAPQADEQFPAAPEEPDDAQDVPILDRGDYMAQNAVPQVQTFSLDNAPIQAAAPEPEPTYDEPPEARGQRTSDIQFKNIMDQNEFAPPAAQPAARMEAGRYGMGFGVTGKGAGGGGYGGDGGGYDRGHAAPAEPPVVVPLKVFEELRQKIQALIEKESRRQAPAVVLGAADYRGEARPGSLSLHLALQVTLGRPDKWKIVPLVGDGAVLARATVGGQPIPVSRQNGYHVWVTQRTGEVTVDIDLLVPNRKPRGAIEYDFFVARTPVTRFTCRFPVAGLEPKIDAAIQSSASPAGDGTLVVAALRPTTRIHLVGFKEIGEDAGRPAKVSADTMNLVSIDEGTLDVFTVVRYRILYASTKEFSLRIPPGLRVVAADGEGAFHYTQETTPEGTLLRGETAFPIRNAYEISLRLHREIQKGNEEIDLPLPQCAGVDRQYGWVAVEVPGKLQLTELSVQQAEPVDVRLLPAEMLAGAVSPILKAYHVLTPAARIRLGLSRLPEKEPFTGSVDRVRAVSQVSAEGTVQTEMTITLRNRLRHNLNLTLPAGSEVLSATLDGRPVRPSQDEKGRIVLPLKRSSGGDRLRPFHLRVSLRSQTGELGFFGRVSLALPALDLPVSSLAWQVFAPSRNIYGRLRGDIEPQEAVGHGTWNPAPQRLGPLGTAVTAGPVALDGGLAGGGGDAGAMPVRLNVDRSGTELSYSRYWMPAGHPVEVSFAYARSWLRIPAWLLLAAVLGAAVLLLSMRFATPPAHGLFWAGALVGLGVLWPLHWAGGTFAILLGLALGIAAVLWQHHGLSRMGGKISEWFRTVWSRFTSRPAAAPQRPARWIATIVLGLGMLACSLLLLGSLLDLLGLLLGFGPISSLAGAAALML